jgi:hypothetical protein
MKQFVEGKPTKIEEVKDEKTGVISYKITLEFVETLTVNSAVKPELNKLQMLEVRHYDFKDKEGKQVKGFKILNTVK